MTGVLLASADDAKATVDPDYSDSTESKRKTFGTRAAMELALRDTRAIALQIVGSIEELRRIRAS